MFRLIILRWHSLKANTKVYIDASFATITKKLSILPIFYLDRENQMQRERERGRERERVMSERKPLSRLVESLISSIYISKQVF